MKTIFKIITVALIFMCSCKEEDTKDLNYYWGNIKQSQYIDKIQNIGVQPWGWTEYKYSLIDYPNIGIAQIEKVSENGRYFYGSVMGCDRSVISDISYFLKSNKIYSITQYKNGSLLETRIKNLNSKNTDTTYTISIFIIQKSNIMHFSKCDDLLNIDSISCIKKVSKLDTNVIFWEDILPEKISSNTKLF